MTDERLGMAAGAWLRDIDRPPPDSHASVLRAMEQVRTTRQVRRWWPLTVFDRPVSTLPSRELAPAPIPATNGRQPARGFTMFSAVKFVVAGVIVALFGGFLLTGVLTTPQGDEMAPAAVSASPEPEATTAPTEPTEPIDSSVRTDILPGVALTVEEVEPGVFQVVNDGVRDLAKANNGNIVAGHDGGIWLARKNRFLRLGGEDLRAWPNKKHGVPDDFEVAPDGTAWATSGEHLYSVGSGSDDWTRKKGPVGGFSGYLEGSAFWVTSDGTVWAMWGDPAPDKKVIGYLGADGWQSVGELPRSKFVEPLVSDRGDIWAWGKVADTGNLIHLVDGAWRTYDLPGLAWGRAVGADGTFWGYSRGTFDRFDGTEWMTFAGPDWVPDGRSKTDPLRVAPDGSVWFGPTDTDSHTSAGSPRRPCRGVGHFDGMSWSRYLPDFCVEVMDVAADGSVWVLASRDDTDDSLPNHVYVITP